MLAGLSMFARPRPGLMEGVSVDGPELHQNLLIKVGCIYKNQTLYAYDDLK